MRLETFSESVSFGPEQTPKVVSRIMILLCIIGLISAFLNPFLQDQPLLNPQYFLSLSLAGFVNSYCLWQPISYFFLLPASDGISVFLIIHLLFNLYIIWIFGSAIAERFGTFSFLILFFGSGIVAGLCCLVIMAFVAAPHFLIVGCTPILFALFMIWSMLNPNGQLLLFFLFPIKTKWLFAGILGASLLIDLSHLNLVGITLTLSGTLYAYLIGTFALELSSPFAFTYTLDLAFIEQGKKFRTWLYRQTPSSPIAHKIVDFQTGEPLTPDDEFVDRMLAKISASGEKALTERERRRLNKIAEEKQRKDN